MNSNFVPAASGGNQNLVRSGAGALVPLAEPVVVDAAVLADPPEESILRRYWRIVLKRRWIVAGIVLASILIGVALAVLSPRMYAATARIEIAREAAQVINLERNQQQPRPGYDQEFYQTQYALLRSRALAEAVVRSLRLADNEAFLTGYGEADPATLPAQRAARELMAVNRVMEHTDVAPVRLSSVVDIRYRSANPEMAARIANSLAENFIQFNLTRRYEANSYARDTLQSQLEQARRRLEDSERRAVAYAAQNQIINIAPTRTGPEGREQGEQSLVTNSLAATNAALTQARTARIAAETQYQQALRTGEPTEALQNSASNALRQERATLNAQSQRQLSDFGPEYPAVQAARAQLAELDRQIASESSRVRTTIRGDAERQYRQALAAERQLAQRVNELTAEAIDLRRRSIQYNIFQRDVDTNRDIYDALLQRYREVGVVGGIGTNNVSIVDRALVPLQPYSPNLRLNILMGLLIGLALGVIAAFVLEQLDESSILPEDFQAKLGVPLLGTVPVTDRSIDPLTSLRDPKSELSEAYLSVLTGLQFSTTHGLPRSFATASTQPGEGKSTTAIAIAQSLSKIGKRVLLIDADMRNPSVHKAMGIENRSGFSNMLTGDGEPGQHVRPSELPNLSIASAGPMPPNPAELLSGRQLSDVIETLLQQFDHIVLDGPPVLGLADAPLLASAVEAVVFVIESRRTKTGQARQAIRRLLGVRATIVGAVLTKLSRGRSGYGYGYGYDYSYGS